MIDGRLEDCDLVETISLFNMAKLHHIDCIQAHLAQYLHTKTSSCAKKLSVLSHNNSILGSSFVTWTASSFNKWIKHWFLLGNRCTVIGCDMHVIG